MVPGEALGEGIGTADWQEVWSAMACYRTTSPTQQRDLAHPRHLQPNRDQPEGVAYPPVILRSGTTVAPANPDRATAMAASRSAAACW